MIRENIAKIISFIILIILIYDCIYIKNKFDNKINISASKCLIVKDTEDCFSKLFSGEGIFNMKSDDKNDELMLRLKNEKEIDLICNELKKEYKDEIIKENVFGIAVWNYAPCVCDYAKNKIDKKDERSERYKNIYDSLECSKGIDHLNEMRRKIIK